MPRKNRSRKKKSTKRQGASVAVLKRIEENTRQELEREPPLVLDKLPMIIKDKIRTFKRSAPATGVGVSTSGTTFGSQSFLLSMFDSTSEVAENFALYRIIELTIKYIPVFSSAVAAGTSGGLQSFNMGNFHTVIDLHNDSVPVSIAELEQYNTHQVVRTGQFVARTWTPRTLGRCYGGVTDAFYAMPAGMWMSTDYNDAVYYGIKFATGQGVSTGNITVYSALVEAVIQCRNSL